MKTRRRCRNLYGCLILPAILLAACDKKDDTGDIVLGPPGSPPRALSLRIDGPSQITQFGQAHFKVIQAWSDGSSRDVTAAATVTSSNPLVLSINAGVAMALTGGAVDLTAQFEAFITQRKTVFVLPATPDWNGAYNLTIGGGACGGSMPPELRQRMYTANITQHGLGLTVAVSVGDSPAGVFFGRIANPEASFTLGSTVRALKRGRTRPVAARLEGARAGRRFPQSWFQRAAYWEIPNWSITEYLRDGNRLVIIGEALATMSPSGFTGTLNGALTLYERDTQNQLAVCSSPSHAFILARN